MVITKKQSIKNILTLLISLIYVAIIFETFCLSKTFFQFLFFFNISSILLNSLWTDVISDYRFLGKVPRISHFSENVIRSFREMSRNVNILKTSNVLHRMVVDGLVSAHSVIFTGPSEVC